MPEMDGLSMIAELRVEFPEMLIAILTGYRDFDYAQKAIRLGVNRFLLKPSNMDEIKEALQFMADTLNKRKGQENALKRQNGAKSVSSPAAELEGNAAAGADGNGDSSEYTSEHHAGSFIVKTALKYMKENYKQKITLAEVAEKTYVSQWHLSKLLNGHTGKSFSELLNHIRIEEAKKLLKDPSFRIGDISEEVGFLDVAHFSKVFKKLEGISANEYRNSRI